MLLILDSWNKESKFEPLLRMKRLYGVIQDYAKTELIRIKSADGLYELPALVTWPKNMDPNKKYPMLVSIFFNLLIFPSHTLSPLAQYLTTACGWFVSCQIAV